MGQFLTSHCYIKLQYLKCANILLWMDAAAASLPMCVTERQLKASYLSFSVGSSVASPLSPSGLGPAQHMTGT